MKSALDNFTSVDVHHYLSLPKHAASTSTCYLFLTTERVGWSLMPLRRLALVSSPLSNTRFTLSFDTDASGKADPVL